MNQKGITPEKVYSRRLFLGFFNFIKGVVQQMTEAGLRNLYTSLILGGATKVDGNSYSVNLLEKRIPVLKKYLTLAKLNDYFRYSYDKETLKLHFEITPLLLLLHKEWSSTLKEIEYISPSQLNINVFNLWITLFHEVKNRKLYITSSHFTSAARETLGVLYTEIMRYNISYNNLFFMTDYREFFLQSYQNRRPLYEVDSIVRVLGPKELSKLVQIRSEYDLKKGVQGL